MYEFLQPTSLDAAVEMLGNREDLRILAGGTDLIIALRDRNFACRYLMDCKKIPETQVLAMGPQGLEVGAAVPLSAMMESGLLTGAYAVLGQAAGELANVLLRNRATLVGNICNASPGGDMLPACLVLGAQVVTASPRGGHTIPLDEFFTGVKQHVLAKDEMAVKVVFPQKEGTGVYKKKKRIRGHDLAQISAAGFYAGDGTLSMAFGAAAPVPILLAGMGAFTRAQLAESKQSIIEKAVQSVNPISDVRSSKEYRISMLRHFTGQILDELANEQG